jgi:hypothetical protein
MNSRRVAVVVKAPSGIRLYAEFCVEVFRLQRQGMHQIAHIQHFGCCSRDGSTWRALKYIS